MFDFAAMSVGERQFIRVYVQALQRDYDMFQSVAVLMNPDGLCIKNVGDATRVAYGLADLHDEFETQLRRIQKKFGGKAKTLAPVPPTMDELADVFSMSFFKLITTVEKAEESVTQINEAGWFSGKPTEWKKTFIAFQALAKNNPTPPMPKTLSDIFTAAMKLFQFHPKKWDGNPTPDAKKLWPPLSAHWPENDAAYSDDDDDSESGPMDWFFDLE